MEGDFVRLWRPAQCSLRSHLQGGTATGEAFAGPSSAGGDAEVTAQGPGAPPRVRFAHASKSAPPPARPLLDPPPLKGTCRAATAGRADMARVRVVLCKRNDQEHATGTDDHHRLRR